jgi:ATP-binding protein involved in chromosome partitioning
MDEVTSTQQLPSVDDVRSALKSVQDPEIRKPITDLGMVKDVVVGADGVVTVGIYLTVAGCPLKATLTADTQAAVSKLPGVSDVRVELDVMSDEQRTELRKSLRGDAAEPVIPFASVGVVDADIYGHSIPRMLGAREKPTKVDTMIMPPQSHGVKVISIGMFTPGNTPVVWRGPMLHRALQQFLADVFWGDLDILLLDLPPGTGDIAISVAQLIPNAEILVVTTPQQAAAEVAERAGAIALQTRQRVAGVIENMSWLDQADGSRLELFGAGGGQTVADSLTKSIGSEVPLLGQVPMDPRVVTQGDAGTPIVLSEPEAPAAQVLAGMMLNVTPAGR